VAEGTVLSSTVTVKPPRSRSWRTLVAVEIAMGLTVAANQD
jgi:hypothetical protein